MAHHRLSKYVCLYLCYQHQSRIALVKCHFKNLLLIINLLSMNLILFYRFEIERLAFLYPIQVFLLFSFEQYLNLVILSQ